MASSIVVEILRNDNYEYWSTCMRNYLLAHDLWDIIEYDHPNSTEAIAGEVKFTAWRKKNARALHAIQISCRPDMLVKIGNPDSAKIAWDNLANSFRKPLRQQVSKGMSFRDEHGQCAYLEKLVRRGDWDFTIHFANIRPDVINGKITSFGETVLHIVTRTGNVENVRKWVDLLSAESLAIQDFNGNTALHLAAFAGTTKMARYMIEKNPHLVAIENSTGFLPIVLACANGHRGMTVYLFAKTPFEVLCQENGNHGSLLLQYVIISKMLDLALEILHRCPSLATAKDIAVFNRTAFSILAMSRDIFPSGCQLGFWQRWIYFWISATPLIPSDYSVHIDDLEQSHCLESKSITQQDKKSLGDLICSSYVFKVLGGLPGLRIKFLEFVGIKQIYDLKMIHSNSCKLLSSMCSHISTVDESRSNHKGLSGVFFNAVEQGVVELVMEMVTVSPSLLDTVDQNGRNPIMSSIVNRQEKIFSLFCGLARTHGNNFTMDRFGNTELHLAGMLSPYSQLDRISGPALQMQRELQWYKKVESIIHPAAKFTANQNGETPAQLFTNEHRQLMIEGVKWVKDTASSCTVVGALIITIMFAAAFTVPGGVVQNQDKGDDLTKIGIPVFLRKKTFMTFIISDAISLFASSASVVTFLGILTSSHGEQDFLESLPRKLIIGLSTLFISLATMMVAFCEALMVTLDGMAEVMIPLGILACVPITLFMFLQFPLLVEIFMSTYGPSIFNRKINHRY